MIENYGKKTISGIMANVAWNTDEAEQVNTWTGHYPALNTFDYMHIRYSGQNWIDYSDISPVTNWANEGGIVSCMWHWNVPKIQIVTLMTIRLLCRKLCLMLKKLQKKEHGRMVL